MKDNPRAPARAHECEILGQGSIGAGGTGGLGRAVSLAFQKEGAQVRVNSILPSIIDTEPNRQAMPKADFTKWPKPEQIARVILFLCSDDAEVVHGAAVPVYGNS